MSDSAPLIVGLCGPSGSGKTSLANWLRGEFEPGHIAVVHEDAYYRTVDKPADHNFDVPMALDHKLLASQMHQLRRGGAVDMPIYNFGSHYREAGTDEVTPVPVLLLEGLFVLYSASVRCWLDCAVFVDTPTDICLLRRLRRDRAERGRATDEILRQYEQSVRPGWKDFVAPSRYWADLVVNGEQPLADTGAEVLALLTEKFPGST